MRKLVLAAGVLATLATATIPMMAQAYTTRCEAASHNSKVAGTVVGGVLGALAGNAISRGGGGAVVGGVAGAALGNNLSRKHCGDGYVERAYDTRYYDVQHNRYRRGYNENRCSWREESVRGDHGRMITRQVQVCS
jgi:uncharacterized protein YcfJ